MNGQAFREKGACGAKFAQTLGNLIQTTTADGQPVHLAQRMRGEHFGEMALIDGKPRMADAITAEPGDLLMLEGAEFVRCIEASPKVALGIMAVLADRLREAADGYAPLAALDDDRSGRLEGAELRGIAVWFDHNGNGISDAGEVVSLEALGVQSIAVHAAGKQAGTLWNSEGIVLRNGRTAATFDWTPISIRDR